MQAARSTSSGEVASQSCAAASPDPIKASVSQDTSTSQAGAAASQDPKPAPEPLTDAIKAAVKTSEEWCSAMCSALKKARDQVVEISTSHLVNELKDEHKDEWQTLSCKRSDLYLRIQSFASITKADMETVVTRLESKQTLAQAYQAIDLKRQDEEAKDLKNLTHALFLEVHNFRTKMEAIYGLEKEKWSRISTALLAFGVSLVCVVAIVLAPIFLSSAFLVAAIIPTVTVGLTSTAIGVVSLQSKSDVENLSNELQALETKLADLRTSLLTVKNQTTALTRREEQDECIHHAKKIVKACDDLIELVKYK
mmetsp:Transcript_128157/g.190976  ORF Transcript_128157/g.190976 Transcript_128157/m.190976 type:complete len:310 (+) Transcript_128157:54-983(+)